MDIRYKIVINIMALVFLIILARLYFLSIVSHEEYEKEARRNITRIEMLVPARGQILDRNNQPLAINSLGYSISLSPYLGRKNNLDTLDKEISKIVSLLPNLDAKQLKDNYMNLYSSYNHKRLYFLPVY